MLNIKIVSSRTVEAEKERKYVAYMLQVRQGTSEEEPANVERRYTHFLGLYTGLKKEFPAILNSVPFPRKIMIGNFDPNLITMRCKAFEDLLQLIANDSRLRESPASIAFFQNAELSQAQTLIDESNFYGALTYLENSFKLLNKVYMDRSYVVLSTLCRTVACAAASGPANAREAEKWANLALRRYEAVSDYNLLKLYVPLLHTCINIWDSVDKDNTQLVDELNDLRKRGMKVDEELTLMEAVNSLENKE